MRSGRNRPRAAITRGLRATLLAPLALATSLLAPGLGAAGELAAASPLAGARLLPLDLGAEAPRLHVRSPLLGARHRADPAGAGGGEIDMEEMSKKLDNPLGDLWMLFIENDTTLYKGFPLKETKVFNTTLIQPVLPIALGDRVNLVTRPIIPLMASPVPQGLQGDFGAFPPEFPSKPPFGQIQDRIDVDWEFNLADIMLFAALTPSKPTSIRSLPWDGGRDDEAKLVYGFGPTFIFPTATDDFLASKKWSMGPVAVLTYLGPKWTYGFLWQHWWDYAETGGGNDKPDVNKSMIQYFIWYSLPDLWSVGMMPVISVNFEGSSGNKLTFPVGLGVSKTLLLGGKLPIRFIFEVDYSAAHPDDIGSRWNFRFAMVPVIPNPTKGGF
jgi:hypothetical protein